MSAEWGDDALADRSEIELIVTLSLARLHKIEHADPKTLFGTAVVLATDIADIYVEPSFREILPSRLNQQNGRPFWIPGFGAPVLDIGVLVDHPCNSVVILGDAGAGKTTFVRRLALTLAEEFKARRDKRFPVYCDLREFARWWEARRDVSKGSATWAKGVALEDLLDFAIETASPSARTQQALDLLFKHRARAVIILDGLDELDPPFEQQRESESAAKSFAQALETVFKVHECRFVVTARSREYYYADHLRLPASPHFELARFSTEQTNRATDLWHAALARCAEEAGRDLPVAPMEGAARVRSLIKKDRALALFASNPLFLQLLQCALVARDYRPASVRDVCERAIEILLRSGEPVPGRGEADADLVHMAMEGVAGRMLLTSSTPAREEGLQPANPGVLSFVDFCGGVIEGLSAASWERFAARAQDFLAVMSLIMGRMRSIIEYEGSAQVGMERTFRGVFAGCYLSRMPIPERNRLGFSAVAESAFESFGTISAESETLLREALLLAAQHMSDPALVSNVRLGLSILAGIARARNDAPEAQMALDRARAVALAALTAERAGVALDDRLAIATALGTIGDPRLSRTAGHHPTGLTPIPPGRARIGREREYSIQNPKYESSLATPIIEVECVAFSIGTTTVTNSWFAEFIDDGGYDEAKYWQSAEADSWRRQDKPLLQELHEHAHGRTAVHLRPLVDECTIRVEQTRDVLESMIARRFPLYWSDSKFALDNQPVVGVNYWEAMAFCKWLEMRRWSNASLEVRLPTEFEWEWAGRCAAGDRDYPWDRGGVEENAYVSMASDPWGGPGPVGGFPDARWKDGPLDLIGNVWEWTCSPVRAYAAGIDPSVRAKDLEERIARGGSWRTTEPHANTLFFRSFDPPYLAHEDLGFRIVVFQKI